MLNGSIAIAIKSCSFFITIEMGNTQYRQVSEPTSQTVIRGPKDSFVESLSTNQSLIRRRIRNKNLHFEEFIIGNETKTKINLVYVKGIANEEIIEEIRTRLNKINVSAIFESANIEELIADKTLTVFPLALNTERPDTVAGNINGRKDRDHRGWNALCITSFQLCLLTFLFHQKIIIIIFLYQVLLGSFAIFPL